MKRYLVLLPIIVLAVALGVVSSGIVFGKGHVPASQVQVCHKGRTALNVDAPALKAHLGHGDIQLAACSSSPGATFLEGADCSGVVDLDGDGRDDAAVTPSTSPACLASGNF